MPGACERWAGCHAPALAHNCTPEEEATSKERSRMEESRCMVGSEQSCSVTRERQKAQLFEDQRQRHLVMQGVSAAGTQEEVATAQAVNRKLKPTQRTGCASVSINCDRHCHRAASTWSNCANRTEGAFGKNPDEVLNHDVETGAWAPPGVAVDGHYWARRKCAQTHSRGDPRARLAVLALLCHLLSGFQQENRASAMYLRRQGIASRMELAGEPFSDVNQPTLQLYEDAAFASILQEPGVRVYAHCGAFGCLVDCGNVISTDSQRSACSAISGQDGLVKFTDLALLDESSQIWSIEFTFSASKPDTLCKPKCNPDTSVDINLRPGFAILGTPIRWKNKDQFSPEHPFIAGENAKPMIFVLLDGGSNALKNSKLQVYASILPADSETLNNSLPELASPEMASALDLTEDGLRAQWIELRPDDASGTCCKIEANCNQKAAPGPRLCDCRDPRSALCQVPSQGEVSFNFIFRRIGRYHIRLRVRTTVSYEYIDKDIVINVGAAKVVKLGLSMQNSDHYIGNVTGDERAVFTPPPRVYFMDVFGNPGRLEQHNDANYAVIALLCYDRNYSNSMEGQVRPGLCECRDVSPCFPKLGVSTEATFGNVQIFVNMTTVSSISTVRFTELYTSMGRTDLRLSFWHLRFGSVDPTFKVFTDVFSVSPGRLRSIEVVTEPSVVGNCKRCPPGVHIAGQVVNISLQLFDAHHNVIAFCHEKSQFCLQHLNSRIIASLWSNLSYAVNDLLLDHGDAKEVISSNGLAVFNKLAIKKGGAGYTFRFMTPERDFTESTSATHNIAGIIQVSTAPFVVNPGRPRSISPSKAHPALVTADAEPFLVNPRIEFFDEFGNLVVNHCYTDCGGSLTGLCALDTSPCSAHSRITVSINGDIIRNNPSFNGHTTATATNGIATFTDLRLDLFGQGSTHGSSTKCTCLLGNCPPCSDCYDSVHPLEDVTLRFTSTIDNDVLQVLQVVTVSRRVQSLRVRNQPNENDVTIAALENFGQPVIIEARACDNQLVLNAIAACTASLRDAPAQAQLYGVLTEPLKNGIFTFTELQVNIPGTYVLQFTYVGNAVVEPISTASFPVFKQVASIDLILTPQGTTTTAGVAFLIQPKVRLLDEDGLLSTGSSQTVACRIEDDPGADVRHLDGTPYSGPTTLHGKTSEKATGGLAAFTDLRIEKASKGQGLENNGYTLSFTARALGSKSGRFHVIPANWAGLHVPNYAQPVSSSAGRPLTLQPEVLLVDRFLNRILPSQVPIGTFVHASIVEVVEYQVGNPSTLLRHGCSESCSTGQLPIVCRTCTDLSLDASDASVRYTDLRVDIVFPTYHLRFHTSDGSGGSFSTDSNAFPITPSNGAGLIVDAFEGPFLADRHITQPAVTITDRFGNLVDDVSKLKDGILSVRVLPSHNQFPVAPPLPPVPGQEPGSICTVYSHPLEGNPQANISTGKARFSDLSVRQVMNDYRLEFSVDTVVGRLSVNSSFFDVIPGKPVRLCNMSLPGRCEMKSPCLDPPEIVCVDSYGNVQKDCQDCPDTMQRRGLCSYLRPLPKTGFTCWKDICVEVVEPSGAIIESDSFCGDVPCSSITPSALSAFRPVYGIPGTVARAVGAVFDSLRLNESSADYRIRFYTLLPHPIETRWITIEYTTSYFQVLPPRPRLNLVSFTGSFVELTIAFDKSTDSCAKNLGETEQCDAYLDPAFIGTLGTPATCSWLDSKRLIVHLGTGATVSTQTAVRLAKGNAITHTATYKGRLMTSLPATTDIGVVVAGESLAAVYPKLPSITPVPFPVISGVRSVGACDKLNLDARSSTGNAGRPFSPPFGQIKWGVNYEESYIFNGILSAKGMPEFINRYISFSSLLPGQTNRVTIKLLPNAPIIQGSILKIHGLPGHIRKWQGCVSEARKIEEPPKFVPCISQFQTKKHMEKQEQDESYKNSRCIDVPLQGPGSRYFELNGEQPGSGIPVAQWFYGPPGPVGNNVELHLRVLGMRADRQAGSFSTSCPDGGNDCSKCNCASYIPARQVTEIHFDIVNPYSSTDPRKLAIESRCDEFYDACYSTYQMHPRGGYPQGPMNWIKEENIMHANCDENNACEDFITFGKDDFDIHLVSGSISENSKIKGAINTISVTIVPSTQMPAGSKIVLKGLTGSGTKSGFLCVRQVLDLGTKQDNVFDCNSCKLASQYAKWTSESGSLELTVKNGSSISASGIAFSFDLINLGMANRQGRKEGCAEMNVLDCPSAAIPQVMLQSPARVGRPGTFVRLPGEVLGSGYPPTLRAQVLEGNSLAGQINLLLFKFSANADLAGESVVSIWTNSLGGLGRARFGPGSRLRPNVHPPGCQNMSYFRDMHGSNSSGVHAGVACFAQIPGLYILHNPEGMNVTYSADCWNVTWKQAVGSSAVPFVSSVQLKLASHCHLFAHQPILFGMEILNHNKITNPPEIYISAKYAGCRACIETCGCEKLDSLDVLIPDTRIQGSVLRSNTEIKIDELSVREDNPVRDQTNTITVEMQNTFDLVSPQANRPSVVTVSGLHGLPQGVCHNSSRCPVLINVSLQLVSDPPTYRTGELDVSRGFLMFTLPPYIPALANISFSFQVRNGPDRHASGLKWSSVGGILPASGRALSSPLLANALRTQTEFTSDEWNSFGIKTLFMDDFIKSEMVFFRPTEAATQNLSISVSTSSALCGLSTRSLCTHLGLENDTSIPITDGPTLQISAAVPDGTVLGFDGTPSIITKSIVELSRVGNAFNVLTVHVRANFRIIAPAKIVLSNLIGTSWPKSTSQISLRPSFMQLLPNCSCAKCEVECECSQGDFEVYKSTLFLWQHDKLFGTPKTSLVSSDVQGFWDAETGELELMVASGRELAVNESIVFAFAVQNPAAKTAPRVVNVTLLSGMSGFNWRTVSSRPRTGRELKNQNLANELTVKTMFTRQDLIDFGPMLDADGKMVDLPLLDTDFIESNGKYFKPAHDWQVRGMMDGRVLGAGEAPAFFSFEARESAQVSQGFNEIFVKIRANFPMVSLGYQTPSALSLTGFSDYNTPGGYMPILGDQAFSISRTGFGNWTVISDIFPASLVLNNGVMMGGCRADVDEEGCALRVPGIFDYTFLATQRFSFIIQNTKTINGGVNIPKVQYTSVEVNTGENYVETPPIGKVLDHPVVLHARMTESSSIQQDPNEITLETRFNVMLTTSSIIRISGFRGSLTESGSMLVTGKHGSVFTGSFDRPRGIVLLTVSKVARNFFNNTFQDIERQSNLENQIPANTRLEVIFQLLNPASRQITPTFQLSVEIRPPAKNLPDRPLCAEKTISDFGTPIYIPATTIVSTNLFEARERMAFTTKSIRESTKVNWGINQITMTLVSPSILPQDMVITLSGLHTPIPSKEPFPIHGPGKKYFMMDQSTTRPCSPAAAVCVPSTQWDVGTGLFILTLKQQIAKGTPIKISFLMRNMGCDMNCQGRIITISARGQNRSYDSTRTWELFSVFDPQPLDGAIMGAGVHHISWTKKTVAQDHLVKGAPNRLTFSFRPNTPLYPGTIIKIDGIIGSPSTTCRVCRPPNLIPGLGCSNDCAQCVPKDDPDNPGSVYRPCAPVYQAGDYWGKQGDVFPLQTSDLFTKNSRWEGSALYLTLKPGMKISDQSDTDVVLILNNKVDDKLLRADCVPSVALVDKTPPKCITISLDAMQICDSKNQFEIGEQCEKPIGDGALVRDPVGMGAGSKAVDALGDALFDPDPVKVRNKDLYQLQSTLERIPRLHVKDVDVDVHSRQGVPTLTSSVVAAGKYTIFLQLTNWLKNVGKAQFTFLKDDPPDGNGKGALRDENPIPQILIRGLANRQITRSDTLILNAVGKPIKCFMNPDSRLYYTWSMYCHQGIYGYCRDEYSTPCKDDGNDGCRLKGIVTSTSSPDLLIGKDKLTPGARYTFVCSVEQWFVENQAAVTVEVAPRPLVVKIEGASPGGFEPHGTPLKLSAQSSYDPELLFTKQTSLQFHYEWSCSELKSKCQVSPALCPPNEFVPCEDTWIDLVQSKLTPAHTIITNAAYLKPDWIYEIKVNATRDRDKLIDTAEDPRRQRFAGLIQKETATKSEEEEEREPTHDDLIVDQRWLAHASSSIRFQTFHTNKRVVITLTLCDPSQLGTEELCKTPLTGMVDPGSKLVLQAVGHSTGGGSILGYLWTLKDTSPSELRSCTTGNQLTSNMLDSSLTSGLLLIKPNTLAPGLRTTFEVTLTDSLGNTGVASIDIHVNHPPRGGGLRITPTQGTALMTNFLLEAEFWDAYVEENLPLTFDFFSLQGAASENSRLSIGTGPSMSIEAVLPAGDATKNNVLFVGVSVSDVLGTAVDMIRNVTVHPPADSTSRSFDQIEDLLESKEFAAAQGLVGAIAQTLNGGEAICAGIIEAECVTGACCARKKERLKLFYKLKQADSQMTATMKTIEDEMRVLQSITVRPEEISYVAAKEISKFVMDKFQRLKGITISKDVVDIAKSFGVVIDQISSSVVASVPDKVAVPYTLNEHHRSKDGAHVSRSTSLRSSITLDDARQLFCDLISMICEMSLLSVRQAESGQKPIVMQFSSFVTTTRVEHLDDQNVLNSVLSLKSDLGFSATLPNDLFAGMPLNTKKVEIMHTVFHEKHNLLPGAKGPVVILEARERGSSVPISLKKPIELEMPYSSLSAVCARVNSTNCVRPPPESASRSHVLRRGYTLTAFGKYFDYKVWKWNSADLQRKTLQACVGPAAGSNCKSSVTMQTGQSAFAQTVAGRAMPAVFAPSEVWAGCDSRPLSASFFDDCGKCGAWLSVLAQSKELDRSKVANTSCSGCDGEPNTGRDKKCSGHGKCIYVFDNVKGQKIFNPSKSVCTCESPYFGAMCDVECIEAIKCSGHGLCSPVKGKEGKECLCQTGFVTSDPASGKFCDKVDPNATSSISGLKDNDKGKLSQKMVRKVLTYGISGFVGLVVLCVALYLIITYRRRQTETIRKTVIEFPQPQLELPAEHRADANVMIPDESGWTNQKLPKATATFSYGPNSGQLASAVASSQRAGVNKMSLERIDRRARNIRSQVKQRSTVNKYKIEGPIHWEGDDDEEEYISSDIENESGDEGGGRHSWFLTQHPEWLPQLGEGWREGSDEDEAFSAENQAFSAGDEALV